MKRSIAAGVWGLNCKAPTDLGCGWGGGPGLALGEVLLPRGSDFAFPLAVIDQLKIAQTTIDLESIGAAPRAGGVKLTGYVFLSVPPARICPSLSYRRSYSLTQHPLCLPSVKHWILVTVQSLFRLFYFIQISLCHPHFFVPSLFPSSIVQWIWILFVVVLSFTS